MGVTQSIEQRRTELTTAMETEVYRKLMLQREVQMAVNIAKARDNIQIFGSIWVSYGTILSIAKFGAKYPVPAQAAIPLVVGSIVLGNLTDMAYGNKLARVNKEASYILDHERARLVPFPQAPFAQFYTPEERSVLYDVAPASGDLVPSSWLFQRRTSTTSSKN